MSAQGIFKLISRKPFIVTNGPERNFYGYFINPYYARVVLREAAMATDQRSSHAVRRSGQDRRSGVDTRTNDEKKAVGERWPDMDRRSGLDRRTERRCEHNSKR